MIIIKDNLTTRWRDTLHQVWKGLQARSFYHQKAEVYNLECITLLAHESIDQIGSSPPHSLGVLQRLCKKSPVSLQKHT